MPTRSATGCPQPVSVAPTRVADNPWHPEDQAGTPGIRISPLGPPAHCLAGPVSLERCAGCHLPRSKPSRARCAGPRSGSVQPGRAWLVAAAVAITITVAGGLAILARPGPGPEPLWRRAYGPFQAGGGIVPRPSWRAGPGPVPDAGGLDAPGPGGHGGERVDAALADMARIPTHRLAPQARLRAGQLELRRSRLRVAEEALRAATALDPGLVQGIAS